MKKDKNRLTGEDLRQIANFHAIVRNYIKMSRLLKEQITMAHTRRDKAIARFRLNLPIKNKEKLAIEKSDDRHNFMDWREIKNSIKYKNKMICQ